MVRSAQSLDLAKEKFEGHGLKQLVAQHIPVVLRKEKDRLRQLRILFDAWESANIRYETKKCLVDLVAQTAGATETLDSTESSVLIVVNNLMNEMIDHVMAGGTISPCKAPSLSLETDKSLEDTNLFISLSKALEHDGKQDIENSTVLNAFSLRNELGCKWISLHQNLLLLPPCSSSSLKAFEIQASEPSFPSLVASKYESHLQAIKGTLYLP